MAASGFDLSSNYIAGHRVRSKNQGAVGKAAVKSGEGNSVIPSAIRSIYDTASLDAYLAASTGHGAGYYSVKRLAQMSKSDKVHAAVLLADPTSQK